MQELHRPVYSSLNVTQGDVWVPTSSMLMCMLMSLKDRTSSFLQFHVVLIYSAGEYVGPNPVLNIQQSKVFKESDLFL